MYFLFALLVAGLESAELSTARAEALQKCLVGEQFTGYLHVTNTSGQVVDNVGLRVEIDVGAGRGFPCEIRGKDWTSRKSTF